MDLNQYQLLAGKTAAYTSPIQMSREILYPALGLAEEAGEVAGQVKRIMRDDGGHLTLTRRAKIMDELGDALWYLAAVARDIDATLEDVAIGNLTKITRRKANKTIQGEGDR